MGSSASVVPRARARLNLRIPPGVRPERAAAALSEHLEAVAPWGVRVAVDITAAGRPFRARSTGPAYRRMAAAMQAAYGVPMVQLGQGGSIPLCSVLADTYPDAEIILVGVEEPLTLIHAANESVAPSEIAGMALADALFLRADRAKKAGELRYPTLGLRRRARDLEDPQAHPNRVVSSACCDLRVRSRLTGCGCGSLPGPFLPRREGP
jgi:hypothetical protein